MLKKLKLILTLTIVLCLVLTGCSDALNLLDTLENFSEENTSQGFDLDSFLSQNEENYDEQLEDVFMQDEEFYELPPTYYMCLNDYNGNTYERNAAPAVNVINDSAFEADVYTQDGYSEFLGVYTAITSKGEILVEADTEIGTYYFVYRPDLSALIAVSDFGQTPAGSVFYDYTVIEELEESGGGSGFSITDNFIGGTNGGTNGGTGTNNGGTGTNNGGTGTTNNGGTNNGGTPPGLVSPIPNDNGANLNHQDLYLDPKSVISEVYKGDESIYVTPIISSILADWRDGYLIAEGSWLFDNGSYYINGLYWNGEAQLHEFMASMALPDEQHIYDAAFEAFSNNHPEGLEGSSNLYQDSENHFGHTRERSQEYVYYEGLDGTGVYTAAPVMREYELKRNLAIGNDEGLENAADYVQNNPEENFVVIDPYQNAVMLHSMYHPYPHLSHEETTILATITDEDEYDRGQNDPIELTFVGVTILTDGSGARIIYDQEFEITLVKNS